MLAWHVQVKVIGVEMLYMLAWNVQVKVLGAAARWQTQVHTHTPRTPYRHIGAACMIRRADPHLVTCQAGKDGDRRGHKLNNDNSLVADADVQTSLIESSLPVEAVVAGAGGTGSEARRGSVAGHEV